MYIWSRFYDGRRLLLLLSRRLSRTGFLFPLFFSFSFYNRRMLLCKREPRISVACSFERVVFQLRRSVHFHLATRRRRSIRISWTSKGSLDLSVSLEMRLRLLANEPTVEQILLGSFVAGIIRQERRNTAATRKRYQAL